MKMKYLMLIISIALYSCKKTKLTEIAIPEPSERVKLLTGHNWAMTHEYIDSTAYAKSHLNEWPLSSTDDFMNSYDTCSWDSRTLFLNDGRIKLLKSRACSASVAEDIGHWRLTNNDNDFVIVGQDTLHIVELNSTSFKMYYVSYRYYQQQLILTEYIMWTYEAR